MEALIHDELVRDRIVVGIKDAKLSEKLQLNSKLTLETAIAEVRQSEQVKKQQAVVRGEDTAAVEAVKSGSRPRQKPKSKFVGATPKPQACTRCGKAPPHGKPQCPAREAICRGCHKKGHYRRCCRSKASIQQVSQAERDSDSSDDAFLGAIGVDDVATDTSWSVKLQLNSRVQEFKVDTGADVTVIPETAYERERDGSLTTSNVPLSGPTGVTLEVCGKFSGNLTWKEKESQQDIYVVRNLRRALLGKPAIEALNVVALVEPIQQSDVIKQFPQVFKGLGKLEGSYSIKLKEDAVPFALTTPRRVPIPLLPKVKEELLRMEKMGVITRIEEATDWCAGMVVVPKPSGKVRICVDLTNLNESVCRERHILPSVEQTLAQIGGAKHFSKLDANSGYWQIQLDTESSKLTTFITPFGRFRFNRLPFGITSAPEHFQRRMTEILGDIEGVVCLVDDVLVSGKTQEEHDQRLLEVLSRIKRSGLTLGPDKCEINKTSVKFLGQVVDENGVRPDPEKVQAIMQMKPPTSVSELRRFLGMVNQQSKLSPHLADQTKPLRELLSSKNHWIFPALAF